MGNATFPSTANRLPKSVRDGLARYLCALESAFGPRLQAVYVHGSIALGDFDPVRSDVDFLTVLGGLSKADLLPIRRLHRSLSSSHKWAGRLEGMYVVDSDLTGADYSRPHPYVKHGRVQRYGQRVGPTARHLLGQHGVVLEGPPPNTWLPPVPRAAIDAEMDFNLNVYWASKVKRPYLFLFNEMVDFAVLTLPRILHTLETGTMISKRRAADYIEARFPQWDGLVKDVRGRFYPAHESPPLSGRMGRAVATRRFIRAMIAHANCRHALGERRSEGTS